MDERKSRREFLRDAGLVGLAATALWGAGPLAGRAYAQSVPAVPGWLEDRAPGGPFEYGAPLNPYELGGEAGIRTVLDKAKDGGVDTIVAGVYWPTVEPQKGAAFDLGPIDATVGLCQERGLKVRLQITGTPEWVHPWVVSREPDPLKRPWYPPMGDGELAEWSRFVGAVARRYGTRVYGYTAWNEPNVDNFFRGSQGQPTYAALLRRAYDAIKAVSADLVVVFGGVALNDSAYLKGYYAAARAYPDAAQKRYFFDEFDVRAYALYGSPEFLGPLRDARGGGVRQLPVMKGTMDAEGDAGKKIFVGEFGYPEGSGWYVGGVNDANRALFLKQAYARARALPYVSGVAWYALHPYGGQGGVYAVGPAWTLLDANLNPNRTYQGLREACGWNRSLKCYPNPPSGTLSGAWTVSPIWEGGAPPSDVYKYELLVDGSPKRESQAAPFPFDTRTVANGAHEVVLAAYTRGGSVYSAMPILVQTYNEPPNTAPTISYPRPAPGSATTDRTPLIAATVSDRETDLSKANIALWVDGSRIGASYFSYDRAANRLSFQRSSPMARGGHSVRIEATDASGLRKAYQWGFSVR